MILLKLILYEHNYSIRKIFFGRMMSYIIKNPRHINKFQVELIFLQWLHNHHNNK